MVCKLTCAEVAGPSHKLEKNIHNLSAKCDLLGRRQKAKKENKEVNQRRDSKNQLQAPPEGKERLFLLPIRQHPSWLKGSADLLEWGGALEFTYLIMYCAFRSAGTFLWLAGMGERTDERGFRLICSAPVLRKVTVYLYKVPVIVRNNSGLFIKNGF